MKRFSFTLLLLGASCATSPKSDPLPGARLQPPPPESAAGKHDAEENDPSPHKTVQEGPVPPNELLPAVSPGAEGPPPLGPFPEGLTLYRASDVEIPSDRALRVAHASSANHHAIVYLHGMCGDSKGADSWIDLATQRGTVITLRADIPCPDRPGYKWPQEPAEIQMRIDAALAHVKQLRGGYLDPREVTLIGYSQGAHRAEVLAHAYPDRYRHLVLGGPPTAADPVHFQSALAVAILGGELEDTTHMEQGERALAETGVYTRFFRLPGAHHGGYGPQGRLIMAEVFTWLERAPRASIQDRR